MVAMILGGICLVYFVILLSVGMDFSVIWLLVGGFLSLGSPSSFWKMAFAEVGSPGGGGILGVCLLIFAGVEGFIMTGMFAKGKPELDYLVILGAQVRGTVPAGF